MLIKCHSTCQNAVMRSDSKRARRINWRHGRTTKQFLWVGFLACGMTGALAAGENEPGSETHARQVAFELTFANRDLIWLGDPASPAASVYIQPGARPIATDVYVTTRTQSSRSPARRYLHEARIAADGRTRTVYAFTREREKTIGVIDSQGRFLPNECYASSRELLPSWPADASILAYDSPQNALYYDVHIPGPLVSESLDFLPLQLTDSKKNPIAGEFSITYAPVEKGAESQPAVASLILRNRERSLVLARADLPGIFRRSDVELGSFDNTSKTYLKEEAYRAGAVADSGSQPSVTFAITGQFTPPIVSDRPSLVLADAWRSDIAPAIPPAKITIDGNFDDWRNIVGVDDPRGDLVPYLEYIPDVDLLEFKVAHDDQHIYLYARVAGQVGRSRSAQGRGYFYAYMDVDRNPDTGFLPTRDDDCYYGVDLGDDCEVQFEFVDSTLRKTFYGFCGLGGNDNVLRQQVTLGRSQYGRFDKNDVERANYKSEYIFRNGATEITEDLKKGTSDTIHLAVSPDGSEVEIVSALSGFLQDPAGRPTVKIGQTIDLAAGMECDTRAYPGQPRWGADSTTAIRGYHLHPVERRD